MTETRMRHQAAIADVVQGWALWRDSCQWDLLRGCFAPGALIRTTWFDGTAADFVEASIRLAAHGSPVQHLVGAPVIEWAGPDGDGYGSDSRDRAVAETRVELLVRTMLDGVPVDVQCYGRFHDRFVRHEGAWKIAFRSPVYDKDRLQPVDPAATVRLDPARLAALPAHYAHLAYVQSAGGATITMDIPAANTPAYQALHEASRQWLREAA
ncbi:MAG: nuclear transport factor 2 family protein [Pseudomonadota bacterium]